MKKNQVDIILPTFNGELYLRQQIQSILNQTYLDFKLLIRDDGSLDGTVEIINDFCEIDNRISFIKDGLGNLGLQKNLELLLYISTANLIFFCDQDDVWFVNKVEIFLNAYKETDLPVLVHSNCLITNEDLKVKNKFINDKRASRFGIKHAFFNFFVQGASSMINKKLKDFILPFPDGIYIHDRYIHLCSELIGQRIYLPEPTMYYRQHSLNLIGSSSFIVKVCNINLSKKFYLLDDKELFKIIKKKILNNSDIANYLEITSLDSSRCDKIKLILKNGISMRIKEIILLLLNN